MSALGDFFKEVADAIRTKKGTTDTIVPINFPAEILSIETGGSGGSSGTDGVYYEGAKSFDYDYMNATLFDFKGTTYYYTQISNTSMCIYKYENETFTKVVIPPTEFINVFKSSSPTVIECDDKVYFYVGGTKHYGTWDGTNFEVFSSVFPYSTDYSTIFMHNNEIYFAMTPTIRISNKYKLLVYKIDKTNGGIIEVLNIDTPFANNGSTYTSAFTVDNEGYITNRSGSVTNIYKFNGSGFDKIHDNVEAFLGYSINNFVVKGRKLYYYTGGISHDGKIGVFDMDTGEYKVLGEQIFAFKNVSLCKGQIHVNCNPTYKIHCIMHCE